MEIKQRAELIVWLKSTKARRQLQRYGQVHYVSRRMKYAILYVNEEDLNKTKETLEKQAFVRKVEPSYRQEIDMTFEHSLDDFEVEEGFALSNHETSSSIADLVRSLKKDEE